jgi:thermitase
MRNKRTKLIFTLLSLTLITLLSWQVIFAHNAAESSSEKGYVAVIPSNQENASVEKSATGDNNSLDEQWSLFKVMALEAWQITSGESTVIVAVLDTGIDQTHEDLAGRVISSTNFTQSPALDDIYGHGTHMAGIIAAADNTVGVTGLAYDVSLMNVKVAEDGGICNAEVVAKGIVWAVDNGAKVINVSLAFTKPSSPLREAVDYAWNKGAIVIAAAGNNSSSTPVYPAAYPNVIAVAATDEDDRLLRWSNRGDWVNIAAPGADIYSTLPANGYGYQSGTSPATALVSGEAALLFTIATDTNGNGCVNDEVRQAIEANCDEVGIDGLSKGRINVVKAVQAMGTYQELCKFPQNLKEAQLQIINNKEVY